MSIEYISLDKAKNGFSGIYRSDTTRELWRASDRQANNEAKYIWVGFAVK